MASTTSPFATTHDGKAVPVLKTAGTEGEVYSATITVGTEAGSTINVVVQLTDFLGQDLATVACVYAYMSDDTGGQSLVGTVNTTSPAIGTDGVLHTVVTDKSFFLTCETDGDIDIDFVTTETTTHYLCLVMPDGRLVISDAITHT